MSVPLLYAIYTKKSMYLLAKFLFYEFQKTMYEESAGGETGMHKMSTKRFLGYDTDGEGKLVINQK
jgi:hypothetical protein